MARARPFLAELAANDDTAPVQLLLQRLITSAPVGLKCRKHGCSSTAHRVSTTRAAPTEQTALHSGYPESEATSPDSKAAELEMSCPGRAPLEMVLTEFRTALLLTEPTQLVGAVEVCSAENHRWPKSTLEPFAGSRPPISSPV